MATVQEGSAKFRALLKWISSFEDSKGLIR